MLKMTTMHRILFAETFILRQSHPRIVQRLTAINAECGMQLTCSSKSVVAMCVERGLLVESLEHLETNVEAIRGMLVVEPNNLFGYGEVYNVCVVPASRRQGYAKQLVQATLDHFPQFERWWLGVDPNNPHFEMVAAMYYRLGFRYEVEYTDRSITGLDMGKRVLGMQYHRHPVCDPSDAQFSVDRSYPIHIPATVWISLQQHLAESVEVGGVLVKSNISMNSSDFSDQNRYTCLERGALVRGQPPVIVAGKCTRAYEVSVPIEPVTFHTHPRVCYEMYKCYIGWPSGPDMRYVVYHYQHVYKHYVVTCEGVYSIALTPAFRHFLGQVTKADPLLDSIERYFTYKEQIRLIVHESEMMDAVKWFINRAQTIDIHTLYPEHTLVFPLFDFHFYPWTQLVHGVNETLPVQL